MDCKFCKKTSAKYSCPRCNSSYCSLPCYQSASHVQCSESFYKEWIETDMSTKGPTDRETMRKTYDALIKMQKEEQEAEDEQGLDSDDDDDLSERLEGIDLDDADEVWKRLTQEERAEFQKMCATGNIQDLVPDFVPWWDSEESSPKIELVQDVTDLDPGKEIVKVEHPKSDVKTKFENKRPTVDRASIVPLKSLLGERSPSPLIKFSLLNVIYAYAYALRYFGGFDPNAATDFVAICFDVSANLRDGQNFDSADVAVESAASAANQNPDISLGSEVCRSVKKDVLKIVRGPATVGDPKNGFLLSALSHLKEIFNLCLEEKKREKKKEEKGKEKKKEPKTEESSPPPWKTQILAGKISPILEVSRVKLAAKKIDFYLSWVSQCYSEYELFYK